MKKKQKKIKHTKKYVLKNDLIVILTKDYKTSLKNYLPVTFIDELIKDLKQLKKSAVKTEKKLSFGVLE